jgi:hypothetical protein
LQTHSRAANSKSADIEALLQELTAIRTRMVANAAASRTALDTVHANYRDSAGNLLH